MKKASKTTKAYYHRNEQPNKQPKPRLELFSVSRLETLAKRSILKEKIGILEEKRSNYVHDEEYEKILDTDNKISELSQLKDNNN